jgi:DNA-binding transcriptional LysR family regulator
MRFMNDFDWSDLDAHALQLLLAVLECGSVTAAAHRLGITQSAVSHGLDKLRAITGDVLFVKSGRGIAATAHAEALAAPARELLGALERFARHASFEPAHWRSTFTIAANDFQRDLLLPTLAARLRAQAPGVVLRIVPSAVPNADMLREGNCQLVVSPRPPAGSDIVQKRLFQDEYRVFFDPAVRQAPRTLQEYLAADHATVVYEPRRSLDLDQQLTLRGVHRRFVLMVPGFAALPGFLRGTALLATVPGLLARSTLRGVANCPPPFPCPPMPMYAVWHLRDQHDTAHRWLRAQLDAAVVPALAAAELSPAAVPGASAEVSCPSDA